MEDESQRHRFERCLQEVEEHPDRASAHYNLALAYTVAGRVKQAEASYLKALEIDPTLVQAWVNLGGVRLMRWEFKGCLEANQEAAKLRDDLPIVHYNMGQAYLYLNDPENLVACCQRVLELDRDHATGPLPRCGRPHGAEEHRRRRTPPGSGHRARPQTNAGFCQGHGKGPTQKTEKSRTST